MKKLFLGVILLPIAACEVTVVEPRYDYRDSLTGHYIIHEYSQTYNTYYDYDVYITRSGYNANDVVIGNFYDAGISVLARLTYDKLEIYHQTIDGFEVEGIGTVYGSSISLDYSVHDFYNSYRPDFCQSTASRDY